MSSQELLQAIQIQLNENPLLEVANSSQLADDPYNQDDSFEEPDTEYDLAYDDLGLNQPLPNYSELDFIPPSNEDMFEVALTEHELTLTEFMNQQLEFLPLSPRQLFIGKAIIDSLNIDGLFLIVPKTFAKELKHHPAVRKKEVDLMLCQIRQFEPIGIAASSLQQCLLMQLNTLKKDDTQQLACVLLQQYSSLLVKHDMAKLQRISRVPEAKLKQAIALIKQLNPRPSAAFSVDKYQSMTPDILLEKHNGLWQLSYNNSLLPNLVINHEYSTQFTPDKKTKVYLNEKRQQARQLLLGIKNRKATLLRIAEKIVSLQDDYFSMGAQQMKPLNQSEIASDLQLHMSTVSRAIQGKFMDTPNGVISFKFFFPSAVKQPDKSTASSLAIKTMIATAISNEDKSRPLSDEKLVQILLEKDITVARRTVSKYRTMLGLPASGQRKISLL